MSVTQVGRRKPKKKSINCTSLRFARLLSTACSRPSPDIQTRRWRSDRLVYTIWTG